jgi:hypothetical protein
MRRGSSSIFINAFLDLPQHVSASHCHHQGVVVSSEATQAVWIVDVYGLRPDAFVGCFITMSLHVSTQKLSGLSPRNDGLL